MNVRRNVFAILLSMAIVLFVLIGGVALLYAVRAQGAGTTSAPQTRVSSAPTAPAASPSATVAPATSAPSSTPSELPLTGADRFALVIDKGCSPPGPPPYVRREDSGQMIVALGQGYLSQLQGAVSPDGRRLAYWAYEFTGQSSIAMYQGGTSTTLVALGDEMLGALPVWSPDGSGLLFVANKGGGQGVPPDYAALRTLDLASGAITELTRVSGRFLNAVAWDRARHVIAATSVPALPAPGVSENLVITEARVIQRYELSPRAPGAVASQDAAYAMTVSRSDNVIRYWPLSAFTEQTVLRATPGLTIAFALWQPGTHQLAVDLVNGGTSAIELWPLDGLRRAIADYTNHNGRLFFRPDGSVLFMGPSSAVEVATGRLTHFALAPSEQLAASLLR